MQNEAVKVKGRKSADGRATEVKVSSPSPVSEQFPNGFAALDDEVWPAPVIIVGGIERDAEVVIDGSGDVAW